MCACVGFTTLFVVSRYYIRADSFSSFFFPLSSLSFVHDVGRGRERACAISACCVPVCLRACVAFVPVQKQIYSFKVWQVERLGVFFYFKGTSLSPGRSSSTGLSS